MALFRATIGGGGIPRQLQQGMDAVLNKKWGTATSYPPEGWPDTVNLMGPLEIKTASGAVATLSDGANDVPCRSVKATVKATGGNGTPSQPVPIVGASSLTVSQRGKNLLPCGDEDEETISQVDFSTDGEGRFTVSGTATGNAATFYSNLNNTYTIKSGDYLHIMNSAGIATASLGLRDTNGVIVSRALNPINRIIDLSDFVGKTVSQISVYLQNGTTYNGTITPMIIHGATSTTFEPYNAIADMTAQIGQTVYGGEYDFDTGVFTENMPHTPVDLNTLTWTPTTVDGHACFFANLPNGLIKSGGTQMLKGLCSTYAITTSPHPADRTIRFYSSDSFNFSRVSIRDDDYSSSTGAEFKTAVQGNIVYELKEESWTEITGLDTHTFETVLGVNNFYCDTGDMELEYRSQGTAYIYPAGEGVSF